MALKPVNDYSIPKEWALGTGDLRGTMLFQGRADREPAAQHAGGSRPPTGVGEGVGVDGFVPHDTRQTFITSLLDARVNLHVVRQLAGNALVETTKLYDRRGE